MAVQSSGYSQTISFGPTWARMMAWAAGHRYWVYDQDSVRVTPIAAGTRQVQIAGSANAWFGGWGVVDRNDSNAVVTLPTVASGTQYFMIVARRTWGETAAASSTAFTYVTASSATTLPARNQTYGSLDEQPLALVSLTAGSTVPVVIADLRVIGTEGGLVAQSALALQYLEYVGAVVRVGNDIYYRILNTAGTTQTWLKEPGRSGRVALASVPLQGGSGSGWAAGGLGSRFIADGNEVQVDLITRRWGAAVTFGTTGGVNGGDVVVITISNVPLPTTRVTVALIYYQNGATVGGWGILYPNGEFKVVSGTPSTSITTVPADGDQMSVVACIKYTVESAT